ncbi:MAG: toll/interleukin-1 receptor domain-containing protein [Roseburia sp.]|nr:toll/interleukin-1 receptor domain-containing protein [Roseburia sp.]
MNEKYKIALSFATEDQDIVEKVYHYLKAENIHVFFAPSPEAQIFLSGKNQREAFYHIFGQNAEYVALFVSKYYVAKEVPMEEAKIALAKHVNDSSVIPIYMDNTSLPADMFNPKSTNYFASNDPAAIAGHLAAKVEASNCMQKLEGIIEAEKNVMNIKGNRAEKQVFIQTVNGSIEL